MRSPSTRREWIEIAHFYAFLSRLRSPSTRREWIEIEMTVLPDGTLVVSLHTEGVD